MQTRLAEYEKKYSMSSEEFLPRYKRGDFEMDDDYLDHELFDWSVIIDSLKKLEVQVHHEFL